MSSRTVLTSSTVAAAGLLTALLAWSQPQPSGTGVQGVLDTQAEHTRIAAERTQAEEQFSRAQRACYQQFSVTSCIDEARAKRRETLGDLRRQEIALNDAERRRRSAEALRDREQRAAERASEDAARQREAAARQQAEREAKAAEKREQGPTPGGTPRSPAERAVGAPQPGGTPRAQQAAKPTPQADPAAKAAFERRQQEAAERRASVARRAAERASAANGAAKPLPVPP